jgi:hypothetical protein
MYSLFKLDLFTFQVSLLFEHPVVNFETKISYRLMNMA